MKWTTRERQIINQYETTSKSYLQLFTEVKALNPRRTFEAMTREIRRLRSKGKLRDRPKDAVWKSLKVGYLDIETTGLFGDIHYMLSWAIKERDKNRVVYDTIDRKDILNYRFDENLIKSLLKAMEEFDVLIGYYSTNFDIPFIRARALKHRLNFFPFESKFHQDVYFMAKSKLKITRKSLKVVCEHLGIEGKTALPRDIWTKAALGHPKSMAYILDHNKWDVRITEDVHKRLESFVRTVKRSI